MAIAFFIVNATFYPHISGSLTSAAVVKEIVKMLIGSIAVLGMSLIPLFFGMIKKSVPTTIVTGFILSQVYYMVLTRPSVYGNLPLFFSLSFFWIIIGLLMAYLAIRKIEYEDVY